jgi:hypothetical protein
VNWCRVCHHWRWTDELMITPNGWMCIDLAACTAAVQAAIPADALPPLEDK